MCFEFIHFSTFLLGCILLLISVTVGMRGRGVFLIFAALSATCLVCNMLIHDFLYVPKVEVQWAICILVSHATRYLCHLRLAFCIVAQPMIAAWIGHFLFAAYKVGFSRMLIVGLFISWSLGATVVYGNLLLRRRLRYLPPGLAKAKFVRLGYLKAT